MQTTTNFGLKKPEGTDYINVNDLNENADKIDTELKSHADSLAEVSTHLADMAYQTPVVVGSQIQLQKQSNSNRLFFKLGADITGNVTISIDGGVTDKPLVDLDGVQITQLEKGFTEVVADATFFYITQ